MSGYAGGPHRQVASRLRTGAWSAARSPLGVMTAVVLFIVILTTSLATGVREGHPVVSTYAPSLRLPATWSFMAGTPRHWAIQGGARAVPGHGGSHVSTTSGAYTYQFMFGPRRLEPRTYHLQLRGDVLSGGLTLGVIDPITGIWLARKNYFAARRGPITITVPFALRGAAAVMVVIANYSPGQSRSSSWIIDRVRLGAVP